MTGRIYHPEDKHPDEYQADLAPNASKGLNHGLDGAASPKRSAHDIKQLHSMLTSFTPEELRQIRVLEQGSRLETRATYVNLADPRSQVIQALGDEDVGEEDWYVAKKDVPYELWNRLVGEASERVVHRPK